MCGIVGYIGYRDAVDVILQGLQRLEYRGYDSAGIAVCRENEVCILKEVGKVAELAARVKEEQLQGCQGIGHTRWATHGGVTQANAHPHTDGEKRITLVHNGIIENYMDLREKLQARGMLFATETDTEVVAKLLSHLLQEENSLEEALVLLQENLVGSYALVVLDAQNPEALYAVRRGSPLVLGMGEKEAFCASDVPALLPYTRKVFYMEDGDMACIRREGITLYDSSGKEVHRKMHTIEWDVSMVEKDGYPHFMLKEIFEQGGVLRATLKDRIRDGRVFLDPELQWDPELVQSWDQLHIVACGTSYYASLAAARMFEKWTNLRVLVDVAS
ncbi:MAG TPA: glutamine--fructose-6-phosphate transaminase (isomerizing), partial [Synergistaceae bacterium]|nr:glutamine--fructose-6-phosphate transaminase (isomerizing) [Synergistaceae bacterium]